MHTRIMAPAGAREELLAGLPVSERRIDVAGTPTLVLEGGSGPPVILLHGPGESAVKWLRILPGLVRRHRVIAPDLPAHAGTGVPAGGLNEREVMRWVAGLAAFAGEPPAIVGQVLGGAIAARYAGQPGARLSRLVLVDSLGLAPFRPAPAFALAMLGFLAHPDERSYDRFMRQCSFDLDRLKREMGDLWEPFTDYNLDLSRAPGAKDAGRLFRRLGLPRIPDHVLDRIAVPVTLIWGRHDRAIRLQIAERVSARRRWPLHVIDDCADDPPRDEPEAFLRALQSALESPA